MYDPQKEAEIRRQLNTAFSDLPHEWESCGTILTAPRDGDGEALWISLEAEPIFAFALWHAHYNEDDADLRAFSDDLRSFLGGDRAVVDVFDRADGRWLLSDLLPAAKCGADALRARFGEGRRIHCRYWDMQKDREYLF